MPLSRKTRSGIRQSRLSFNPLPSSGPSKSQCPSAIQNRLANVRYDGASVQSESVAVKSQKESLPTPEPSSQIASSPPEALVTSSKQTTSSIDAASSSASARYTEDEIPLPSSKRRKLVRGSQLRQTQNSTPTRQSRRLRAGSTEGHITISSDRTPSPIKPASSSVLLDFAEAESTGDEDVPALSSVAKRRSQQVVDTDFVALNDSKNEAFTSTSTRRRPKAKDDFVVDDDVVELLASKEDAPAASTQQRRRLKKPKTPKRTQEEQEELDDELADLQDSGTPQRHRRTRGGPVTTQRDKTRQQFELLRRRRAGERVSEVELSDFEESEDEGVDLDHITHPCVRYELSDVASAHSSIDTDPERAEDPGDAEDDFIEDDSPSHGRLPHPDIPIEFTSFATAKPRELFPHIIEWLVKNKIAPAFSRHDQLYQLAFDKIENEVKAQAGSRLISSSWGETFKYAILARPNMEVTYLPFTEEEFRTCDACNRTNHPAT